MSFVDAIFDLLFGWAVAISPLLGIIIISFVLSVLSTVSWKYLTDQVLLKDIRERMKGGHAKLKEHKDNPEKLKELNSKMAKENIDAMKVQWKQSIKPMLVTMVPFAFAFIWIRKTYEPFGEIFLSFGGIGAYIIFSIVFSMILRKVMKVY